MQNTVTSNQFNIIQSSLSLSETNNQCNKSEQKSSPIGSFIRSALPTYHLKEGITPVSISLKPKIILERALESFSPPIRVVNTLLEFAGCATLLEMASSLPAALGQTATPATQTVLDDTVIDDQDGLYSGSGDEAISTTPEQSIPETTENPPDQTTTSKAPEVIKITTKEQFKQIGDNPTTLARHYQLGANIDATGLSPIGSQKTPFTGSLDGNGYSVKTDHCLVGRVGENGRLEKVNIVDSHIQCAPRGGDGACLEAPLACEVTGNSTLIDNTVNNASVSCGGSESSCSLFVNRLEINSKAVDQRPLLSGNSVSNSQLNIAGYRTIGAVGITSADLVFTDHGTRSPISRKEGIKTYIGGIESHNNTVSVTGSYSYAGVQVGRAHYVDIKSHISRGDGEVGSYVNGQEIITHMGSDFPISNNPQYPWAHVITDQSPVCNTTINERTFNENCPVTADCPEVSVIPACHLPLWLLPVGIGIGALATAGAYWFMNRRHQQSDNQPPIPLASLDTPVPAEVVDKEAQTSPTASRKSDSQTVEAGVEIQPLSQSFEEEETPLLMSETRLQVTQPSSDSLSVLSESDQLLSVVDESGEYQAIASLSSSLSTIVESESVHSGQTEPIPIGLEAQLSKQKDQYALCGGQKAEHLTAYLTDLIPIAARLETMEACTDHTPQEIMAFVEYVTGKTIQLKTAIFARQTGDSDSALDSETVASIELLMTKVKDLVTKAELMRKQETPEDKPYIVPQELIDFVERLGKVQRLIKLFEKHDEMQVSSLPEDMRKSILSASTDSLYDKLAFNDATGKQ